MNIKIHILLLALAFILGLKSYGQPPGEKAINYDKVELYREIGLSAYFEMDYEEAIKKLGYVVRYIKTDHESYFYRGLSKAKMGNLKGAIREFGKAIAIDSTNIDYYFKRAAAEYHLMNWHDALNDFSKAIELDPSNNLAYYHRAYCHQQLGNSIGACRDLKESSDKNFQPAIKAFKKSCNNDGTPKYKGKLN